MFRPRNDESAASVAEVGVEPTNIHQALNLAALPTLRTRPKQSVQRESNPHIYHGKVAGYRYIMDATSSGGWNRTSTLPSSAGRSTFELHRNKRDEG
jgi:hypothetical protein